MKTLKQYNAATQSWDVVGPAGTTGVIDLTSASSDYALAVGETATITYISATSVPLRVATGEGIYDMSVLGDTTGSTYTGSDVLLYPNNTTYAAGVFDYSEYYITSSTTSVDGTGSPGQYRNGSTFTSFPISNAQLISSDLRISTITVSKCVRTMVLRKTDSTTLQHLTGQCLWADTTTKWTSLGTITFPFAQSGKIVIRRIA